MPFVAPSLPTGLIPLFTLFIDGVKRAMAEGIGRRHDTLGPLAILLWRYLSATLRRLAALHARFAAGKLPAAPRARRPAAARATADPPEARAPAAGHSARARCWRPCSGPGSTSSCRCCWTIPRCGRCSPPRRRPGGSCGRCGASSRSIRCPRCCACRRGRVSRAKQRPSRNRAVEPEQTRTAPAQRPAWWSYPVSLWADPVPAAEPAPSLPPWPPPFSRG